MFFQYLKNIFYQDFFSKKTALPCLEIMTRILLYQVLKLYQGFNFHGKSGLHGFVGGNPDKD